MYRTIIIIICLFAACNSKTLTELPVETKKMVHGFSELSNFSYISLVEGILEYNNKLFFNDFKNVRLIRMDKAGQLEIVYGNRKGNAPGDFVVAGLFAISSDKIYACDAGNQRFNVFAMDGRYLKSFPFPKNEFNNVNSQFAFDSNSMFYIGVNLHEDYSILKIDTAGQIIDKFGTVLSGASVNDRYAKNDRHILYDAKNNTIIAVNLCEPIIEIYTPDGKLKQTVNLSHIKEIDRRLAFARAEKTSNADDLVNQFILFDAVYLYDNKLYLLFVGHRNENPACYQILVLNRDGDSFVPEKIIELPPDNWYGALCVTNQSIIAFNQTTYEIQYFE